MPSGTENVETDTTRLLARAEEQMPVSHVGNYSRRDLNDDVAYRLAQGAKEQKKEVKTEVKTG